MQWKVIRLGDTGTSSTAFTIVHTVHYPDSLILHVKSILSLTFFFLKRSLVIIPKKREHVGTYNGRLVVSTVAVNLETVIDIHHFSPLNTSLALTSLLLVSVHHVVASCRLLSPRG